MKVAAFLLFLAVVSVALARRREKQNGVENGKGENGKGRIGIGGVPSVSKKQLAKFERRCVDVARRAIAVMGEAAARSVNMSKLADPGKIAELGNIGNKLFGLHDVVKGLMVRGQLILTRAFVSGIGKEDRCEDISPDDLVMRELVSSEYTLKDKRVMCLLRSIGEIIKAFEIATRQFDEEALEASLDKLHPRCDQVKTFAEQGDVHLGNPELFYRLHKDFVCLKDRIAFFALSIESMADMCEAASPHEVRMGLLMSQLAFQWMVDDTTATLVEVLTILHPLMTGSTDAIKPHVDDDSDNAPDYGNVPEVFHSDNGSWNDPEFVDDMAPDASKPDSDTEDQKPDSDTADQKPDSDAADQKPDAVTADQKPDAVTADQKPDADTADQKPDSATTEATGTTGATGALAAKRASVDRALYMLMRVLQDVK